MTEITGLGQKYDLYDHRIKKSEWSVKPISIQKARRLVVMFHYAQSAANTATYLHGLYRLSDMTLHGVAWWMPPTRGAAASFWPKPEEVLTLSRLVLDPEVPKNGASFLLMRSVRMISTERWPCLITYADTWKNHCGDIYRNCGWEYRGLTKPERTYVLDERLVSRKAGPHTRTHREMEKLGALCVGSYAKHRFCLVRRPHRHGELGVFAPVQLELK